MIVVIDTNVLVSALLNPAGIPAKILKMLLDGRFVAAVNEDIIEEYTDVLNRAKFGFNPYDIADLMSYLCNYSVSAIMRTPSAQYDVMHEDDRKFLEVAIAAKADFLITGNLKHFPDSKHDKLKIISPAGFINFIK